LGISDWGFWSGEYTLKTPLRIVLKELVMRSIGPVPVLGCLPLLFALMLAGICEICIADSPGRQLTPDALKALNRSGEPPFRLYVTATAAGERMEYRVTVERKKGDLPPKLEVRLNVVEAKSLLVSCPVAEHQAKTVVSYDFVVSRKHLAESLLIITDREYVPKDEPEAGGAYWFQLIDFAEP
jgi:hypothetical protein